MGLSGSALRSSRLTTSEFPLRAGWPPRVPYRPGPGLCTGRRSESNVVPYDTRTRTTVEIMLYGSRWYGTHRTHRYALRNA
eukprot:scaffold134541_cov22-Prasinocladus_malaysianus.AAC.1